MWQSVFKFWIRRALGFVCTAVVFGLIMAPHVRGQTIGSLSVGVDVWQTPNDPARYLPNYSTPNPWQDAKPWVNASVQHRIDTEYGHLTVTAAGKTDPVFKGRIDRLDADMRLGAGGVRVGVLPYRVSWCRSDGGPWISEPDAFCRFAGLNEVSQGAFGVQAYRSTLASGWLLDGMAGIYRPLIDGQNDKLGPYVSVGPTVKHRAHGASVNAIHLASGIETRLGWIQTLQDQNSDAGSYQRRMRYDSYYLAAQGHVTPKIDLRASLSGYLGEQVNPALPFAWDGRSTTLEAVFKPDSSQSIALGLSRYTNVTTYSTPPNGQALQVDSVSLAWKKNFQHGVYAVLQATQSRDHGATRRLVLTEREGEAYGVRVAKVF